MQLINYAEQNAVYIQIDRIVSIKRNEHFLMDANKAMRMRVIAPLSRPPALKNTYTRGWPRRSSNMA